tara:strand:+ start:3284 stop:3586 length:303 start_codon:yes stop_codon:yes gene_type:complete
MDYYISRYTVTKLDNALNSYKRRILMDFHKINNLKISYKEFENQVLGVKSDFKERYNEDRCYAYVWDKDKKQKRQCYMSKQNGNFCTKHCEVQNYGIIKI